MSRSRRSSSGFGLAVLCSLVLLAFAPIAQGATQFIQLGDSFTGTIADPGDTVGARFNAVQGSKLNATVRTTAGSLNPSVVLRDGSGAALNLGGALSLKGKFVQLKNFPIPASGTYLLVVGSASGTGDFEAKTRSQVPNRVDLSSLSGVVTNSLTGGGLAGASVVIGPYSAVTDASGAYSAGELPAGDYAVAVFATNFVGSSAGVTLLPRVPSTLNVALTPIARVLVSASVSGDAVPGGVLTARATVTILDGSTLVGFEWSQAQSVMVDIANADQPTATVTLPGAGAYKEELIHVLSEPPIAEEDLPPNIELPEGGFVGGLQDRFQLVGLDPFSLEEAGHVGLEVAVTTTSGVYTDDVDVATELPWKRTLGIRDVPIGVPVLLHGKDQAAYDWTLAAPGGSGASLMDAAGQNPMFTPDVPGKYTVAVSDLGAASTVTLEIYAGTWRGVIVGQDADGRPVSDGACTGCHSDASGIAPDKFTPWAQTGHAEIFTDRLNAGSYSTSCFGCHSVGFEPGVANGGLDDAPDYAAFDAELRTLPAGDKWTTMLAEYPATAQLANIQCENCHGPQDAAPGVGSGAHGPFFPEGEPRVSLSSDACAYCHGEPLRHGRFQQWQLSRHANYELAVDEGDDGSCSRCHTANGFLTWLPVLTGEVPGDPLDDITVTWEPDETHPQTCVTCHDPHAIGTTTGTGTNATVRISESTPPLIAGFTAVGVGRGAICMTCHNSRRGLRNDAVWGDYVGTSEASRAPHGSAQTDVLMGENAYLMNVGVRGRHSLVFDTCVNCHMERTPPPADLSYDLGGSNHTFAPDVAICSQCHGAAFDAQGVQTAVEANLEVLKAAIEAELAFQIDANVINYGCVDLNGQVQITGTGQIVDIEFTEYRGQQAITVTLLGSADPFGPYAMSSVYARDAACDVSFGRLYDNAPEELAKAGWNYALIHNDGSHGVHNPTFALEALDAGIDALAGL